MKTEEEYHEELEAYRTAWRELREWLDNTLTTADIDTFGSNDDWYKGYGAAIRHMVKKRRELEKSHVLD